MNEHNNHRLEQLAKLFVSHEYIRIQIKLKNIFNPHVTRSTVMPRFCRLELPLRTYGHIKILSFYTKSFYDALYWGFCIVLLRMSGFRKLDHNYCISETPDTRNSTNL